MSSTNTKSFDGRKNSSISSQFNSDNLSENDIELIWRNLVKNSKQKKGNEERSKKAAASVDTTPTTDYSEKLFPLHPETEEEALEQDKQIARMNSVLKAKKLHPKSYLPQVILYDNVSHDRLLAMRLDEIKHAHQAAEKRAKRKEESFVKTLERKQKEWTKRDARVLAKLEPENLSEFNFTFGRLYNKPDYPYQAVVQTLNSIQPPARMLDHARSRPTLLPQVTNRPIYDDEDEEDRTFITKLPKLKESNNSRLPPTGFANASRVLDTVSKPLSTRKETKKGERKRREGRRGKMRRTQDWTTDKRFHTLTNLLGERYSPHPPINENGVVTENTTVLSTIM